jgi:hypothetical protein
MEQKHIKNMSVEEQAAELVRLKSALPPELPPLDTSIRAKDMSSAERVEWLAAHRKRFPS